MEETRITVQEETLDPQDWEALRQLGHQMVDDMLHFLSTVRERPVWQPIPVDIKAHFEEPIPTEPLGPEEAYEDFQTNVLPYPMGNIHPRFWGWVIGTGTPFGMLAEMLAAGMNPNQGGGDHASVYVERQVLNWFKSIMGFPQEASGLLVSGGSMANLVGITVARNAKARFNVRQEGLQSNHPPMVLYASKETHSSVQKAVELLGLGSDYYRQIPVNAAFEIDIPALEAAITSDLAAGLHPFCIVGNAGTVNTGAFDDLDTLADIAARHDMWYHVDGAFGALGILSPEIEPRLGALTRADSMAFDLHKWMYMPYEVGVTLVRSEAAHRHAFSLTPDYLHKSERGVAAGGSWFSDYGIQLSRGFRALKVWMSIKEHGLDKYARMVQQNIDQARYLASLVDTEPELERLAPVPLNIVTYRYAAPGMDRTRLNALNSELLLRLQEEGIAIPSSTMLNGDFAIRVAISNQRSRREDFDLLVRESLRLGREIAGS